MNKSLKIGSAVTWKKLEGESRRADWTGVILKTYEDGFVVEWTKVGDTSGKTKVQTHRGEQASRVLAAAPKEEPKA